MMMQGGGMKRPDPTEMANDLFSKLDTSGQGYIGKADLQNAFDQTASKADASGSSTSANDLFSQLDANGDGKVTKQEFTDSVKKLADQLDQQFQSARMQNSMSQMGEIPPGPPPGVGEDKGMTKDQLTSAAQAVSGSDSSLSSMLTNIAQNFDAADTNQDGKVTMQETLAYQQSSQSTAGSGTSTTAASENAGATASSSDNFEAQLMMQVMRLAQSYGIGQEGSSTATSSLLATA
jgi:Ca2+-binding EF-hand superfamily protein